MFVVSVINWIPVSKLNLTSLWWKNRLLVFLRSPTRRLKLNRKKAQKIPHNRQIDAFKYFLNI